MKSSPSIWHLLHNVKSMVKSSPIFVTFIVSMKFTGVTHHCEIVVSTWFHFSVFFHLIQFWTDKKSWMVASFISVFLCFGPTFIFSSSKSGKSALFYKMIMFYSIPLQLRFPQASYFCSCNILNWVKKKTWVKLFSSFSPQLRRVKILSLLIMDRWVFCLIWKENNE